jgi:hypothetical protein
MLENIETIDWSKLSHAYGKASDTPSELRKLLSHDADDRTDAIHDFLLSSLWHQGSMYSATPVAIPFVIELLRTPSIEDIDDGSDGNMLRHLLNFLLCCAGHKLSWHRAHTSKDPLYQDVRGAIIAGFETYQTIQMSTSDPNSQKLIRDLIQYCKT